MNNTVFRSYQSTSIVHVNFDVVERMQILSSLAKTRESVTAIYLRFS